MSGRIVIDPAWVHAQAQAMRKIHDLIEDKALSGAVDHYAWALGSGTVAGRLVDVMTNWSQERAKLSERLAGLAKFADTTAQAHQQLDHNYAVAFGQGKPS